MVKPRAFCNSPTKGPLCPFYTKLGEPMARPYIYGEEKNFLLQTVCTSQTVPTAESIGRIKGEFRICGWKKRPALRHCSSISVQRVHGQRSTLTGHLRNYESISGIPTHTTEIQTTESTTSVDVCLTTVCFSSTANKTKYPRKTKRCQGT
jgi:hypothetical protein